MDKRISMQQLVGSIREGDLIAFGGGSLLGSLQRKSMAAAKAIALYGPSHVRAVVFLGGPEVDLLIGVGKMSCLSFSYVGMDDFGLAPNFRKGRQDGSLKVVEYSEYMILAGLTATIKNVPFMPTRSGMGTDVMTTPTSPFKIFKCPITSQDLVAVPAIAPDIALVHVNVADELGNGLIIGDAYADILMIKAAKKVFLTAEKVVKRLSDEHGQGRTISRLWVDGVCETPKGAHFASLYPDYYCDFDAVHQYVANAHDRNWLNDWLSSNR